MRVAGSKRTDDAVLYRLIVNQLPPDKPIPPERVRERSAGQPYRMPTRPMHVRTGVDLTHALELAASLEDEEIVRKLRLGK